MKIYPEEKIGRQDLFTGRKEDIASLLKWVNNIKPKLSQ